MQLRQLPARVQGRYQRTLCGNFARRSATLNMDQPCVSFTFDDFPVSALEVGGRILAEAGCRGTFYASLGLMDTDAPAGRIFSPSAIPGLLEEGHELGCHTYDHYHPWDTDPDEFVRSVERNRSGFEELAPGVRIASFAYPLWCPRPAIKKRLESHFDSCRYGGQWFNAGTVDLNLLGAFFLEKVDGDLDQVKTVIDAAVEQNGWMIMATHDVCNEPSPFGCRPDFFASVLDYALERGMQNVTVGEMMRTGFQSSVTGS